MSLENERSGKGVTLGVPQPAAVKKDLEDEFKSTSATSTTTTTTKKK